MTPFPPGDRPASALVLLHGIVMSGNAWRNVVPLLSGHHEVHTPSIAGHRGGSPAPPRPATVCDLVDDIERYLDAHSLDRPYIAGLSLGGWMAIELARRGRATAVCALAPGGFWSPGDRAQAHVRRKIRKLLAMGRLAAPLHPAVALAMKCAAVRRISLRDGASHADRMTAEESVAALDDIIGCTLDVDDIVGSDQQLAPLDPLPCPVTIAWSGQDRVIPRACDTIARDRVPGASFTTVAGVGHAQMIDDPALVARTILAVTGGG